MVPRSQTLTHQDVLVSFSEFSEGLGDLLPCFGLLEVTVHGAIFLLKRESPRGSQQRPVISIHEHGPHAALWRSSGIQGRYSKAGATRQMSSGTGEPVPGPNRGIHRPWATCCLGSLGGVRVSETQQRRTLF